MRFLPPCLFLRHSHISLERHNTENVPRLQCAQQAVSIRSGHLQKTTVGEASTLDLDMPRFHQSQLLQSAPSALAH